MTPADNDMTAGDGAAGKYPSGVLVFIVKQLLFDELGGGGQRDAKLLRPLLEVTER